ncbi:MAG: ABC transporter permease [bacterium]|nr:ABC transporter permease [bacterium]
MTADRAPQSGSLEAIGAGRSRWGKIRYVFGQSKSLVAGTVLVGMFIVIALLAKFITPHDPSAVLVGPPLTGVSAEHWFGTDKVGSDVFSKTIAATALDLRITASAVLAALVAGVALGTVAGYYAGVVDLILLRLLEILQSIPTLLLAMMVVVAIGPGELNVVVVMAFIGMPYYARLVRAEILTKRTWEFAEAARMVGGSAIRVAFRHLLPNSLSPVLAYASVNAAWVVLVTAALGFLGIGIEPGTAEWWVSVFPGLFVLILTTGFYLLGDGVRDVMDPRSRK